MKFGNKLCVMAILCGICCSPVIHSTTLARVDLVQLTAAADAVARLHCTGTESRWENGSIWTIATFDVLETMKGGLPSRIVVRLPGGKVGPFNAAVDGTPKFNSGEEAIVFLERLRTGGYSVAGWVEGTFRIALDSKTHQEIVTQDSSDFAIFDTATRTFRTEGIRKMPMELFRARIVSAIALAREKSR